MTYPDSKSGGPLDHDRLRAEGEVMQLTGYTSASLRNRVLRGDFPSPLRLNITLKQDGREMSERRWWYSDVKAWLRSQVENARIAALAAKKEVK